MTGRRLAVATAALLCAWPWPGGASAPDAPPVGPAGLLQQGARLFRDPRLGTSGKSCASCHERGQRLDPEELAAASDARLGDYVNSCIEGMLKGKPLAAGSSDLAALVGYLRSLRPPP